ncbi:MAG TPA: AI-2E family transporter [Gaiellaceae bacterium]|nr:AI-2E family transporter [Gaiellaceae bacterium]
MSPPAARPPRIEIPRWVQLVGLPVGIFFAWAFGQAAAHTLFLFLIAALIALLLDPLVLALGTFRLRRGFSVVIVYLTFIAAFLVVAIALVTVVVGQTKTATERFNAYFTVTHGRTHQTSADHDVDRLQHWLNRHHLRSIKIERSGHRLVKRIHQRDIGRYTHRIVNFLEGAAISIGKALFDGVLVLVVSIYMLIDMQRLSRAIDRRFPPHGGRPLIARMEHALVSYVRGQILLSLIIGASAGFGLWIFGLTGLVPHADHYALVFGGWVAFTEVLPYLGPWLGAIPAAIYAVVVHPFSVIWVVLLFLAIHQVEGHVVVPKVMGSVLRLHPLLVIFGLLAGANIDGLAGALMALPLLSVGRAMWEFFAERLELESWKDGGSIPVEVEPASEHVHARQR